MKKKTFLLIPAMLSMFLAACGSGGGDEQSKSQEQSSSAQQSSSTQMSSSVSDTQSETTEESQSTTTSSSKKSSEQSSSEQQSSSEHSSSKEISSSEQSSEQPTSSSSQSSSSEQQSSSEQSSSEQSSSEELSSSEQSSSEEISSSEFSSQKEKVDIKGYLLELLGVTEHNPYSYIPNTMKPTNVNNFVTASQVTYDFTNFTNVSDIKYGGFGEQWRMVIDNVRESENFYSVLTLGEAAINASVAVFGTFLDNYNKDTVTHTIEDTGYKAKIDFNGTILKYIIQYKTNLTIPFFGKVTPQIDMTFDITTFERAVRIQLTDNNAMKYVVTDNMYSFGIEYGVETVSRKAYFQISRDEENNLVAGHIYEFVQYKDKDLVPACADFYIGEEYTSVVGNKARGLVGFTGYINELYETSQGRLLGYEVRETLTILGVTGQYNTLWFNLNNITGINNVKAIENENHTGTYSNKNPHDIYVNGSSKKFEPTFNKKAMVKTSRKYDIELRKQYFYNVQNNELNEYETEIPMMLIQADNDKDTNFTDFPTDILKDNNINASVNLATKYLNKIQTDYATLIDVFIAHKDNVTGQAITDYIGDAAVIE